MAENSRKHHAITYLNRYKGNGLLVQGKHGEFIVQVSPRHSAKRPKLFFTGATDIVFARDGIPPEGVRKTTEHTGKYGHLKLRVEQRQRILALTPDGASYAIYAGVDKNSPDNVSFEVISRDPDDVVHAAVIDGERALEFNDVLERAYQRRTAAAS